MSFTHYALYCLQNNEYMATGRNATSKAQLKEELISYISIDFEDDEQEEAYSKLSVEELASMWEFRIDKKLGGQKFDEVY